MTRILDLLERFDAEQPDGLLQAITDAPGVTGPITIQSSPRRGNHGHHIVMWTQNGRKRSAEGNTLATALRAAVRAVSPRSASPEPAPTPNGEGRTIWRAVS